MMRGRLNGMTPAEKMTMMKKMMPLESIDPKPMHDMMAEMMPRMMGQHVARTNPADSISTMHEMIPKIMESCFSQMKIKEKRNMISMCKDVLSEIEKNHAV